MRTGDQIDARGHHGRRVDQCGNRGWARHRVRQPGLQRQLRRFTNRAAQQHQGRPGDGRIAHRQFLRCQDHQLADIQRAQLVVEDEQCERQEHVAHAGHDEGFHRRRAVGRIFVVEADQQVAAQAHAFPTQIHQQQVVRQHQDHHAGDKQVGVSEEARIALFTAHVPGSEHVDEEADAGDHRQHGQRQAVQHQGHADIEVADGHPGPQALLEQLHAGGFLGEEIHRHIHRDQRSQADRAHADGSRRVLRPTAAGKCQQQEPDQR